MAHYTIDIEVTEGDFDQRGFLRADRIFHYFQQASEAHVNSLGVGPDDIIKKDYIWVLTKMRVRRTGKMKVGEKYICTTFPASQKRATFKRDYYINYAKDGADPDKAVIIGASQWCILNSKTRKLEKTDINFNVPEDEIDIIEGVFPKIHSENPQLVIDHAVNIQDLDYNNHCNNTRYIVLSEEATGKNMKDSIYVNFASETRLGDTFSIFAEEHDGGTYVEGRKDDGTIVYQMIIS